MSWRFKFYLSYFLSFTSLYSLWTLFGGVVYEWLHGI